MVVSALGELIRTKKRDEISKIVSFLSGKYFYLNGCKHKRLPSDQGCPDEDIWYTDFPDQSVQIFGPSIPTSEDPIICDRPVF